MTANGKFTSISLSQKFNLYGLFVDYGTGLNTPRSNPGDIWRDNKLIRQYIPKGTDFASLSDKFIRKIQHKINRRPRKKLNFKSPKDVFFKIIANFALAC